MKLNWLTLLPLIIFTIFTSFYILGLNRENADELPSALIGQTAPILTVEKLANYPTIDELSKPEKPYLVNFWASWCAPCRAEHPLFLELANEGVRIIGINFKDKPHMAQAFLDELGNPFAAIGSDTGRNGVNWGLYGVPETFVISKDGTILLRHPGPLTKAIFDKKIKPLLK